jgi:Predicted membrane protein (DUF2207)
MLNLMVVADFRVLLFPALLTFYYLAFWARVGRDPGLGNVTPEYEPPAGISPAVARYILSGGTDGTTLVAVLTQLTAKGVVSMQPQASCYRIELLQQDTAVQPEEAALIQVLFSQKMQAQPYASAANSWPGENGVPDELREAVKKLPVQQLASQGLAVAAELAMEPRKVAVIDPKSSVQIKVVLAAIQNTFRKNLEGIYFRWNFVYVLLGIAATFIFGLGTSLFIDEKNSPAGFVTLWLLLFTTIAGSVIAMTRASQPRKPTVGQRLSSTLMPLVLFLIPGLIVAHFALPSAQLFVAALLVCAALNSVFMVLMRAPTEKGVLVLRHLAGFREFLLRVEQDQLERMNTAEEKARLMNRYLPYAIAMGVREGWGDTMAAAFSNAIVER